MTASDDSKSRSGVLTIVSLIVTVVYLAIVAALAKQHWNDLHALTAEGLGSLLQAVFSPLAFGWLVVGYFLQRKELELQRHELRANNVTQVDQQRAMDRQADLIAAQVKLAINRVNSDLDMVFSPYFIDADAKAIRSLSLQNIGGNGYRVVFYALVQGEKVSHEVAAYVPREDMLHFKFGQIPQGVSVAINIEFTRQDGTRRIALMELDASHKFVSPLEVVDLVE